MLSIRTNILTRCHTNSFVMFLQKVSLCFRLFNISYVLFCFFNFHNSFQLFEFVAHSASKTVWLFVHKPLILSNDCLKSKLYNYKYLKCSNSQTNLKSLTELSNKLGDNPLQWKMADIMVDYKIIFLLVMECFNLSMEIHIVVPLIDPFLVQVV